MNLQGSDLRGEREAMMSDAGRAEHPNPSKRPWDSYGPQFAPERYSPADVPSSISYDGSEIVRKVNNNNKVKFYWLKSDNAEIGPTISTSNCQL